MIQTATQRFGPTHGEPCDGARLAILLCPIRLLDLWNNLAQQDIGEFRKVPHRQLFIRPRPPSALDYFKIAITQGHHDNHRLRFSLRNQIVENHIGAANRRPAIRSIAETVQ